MKRNLLITALLIGCTTQPQDSAMNTQPITIRDKQFEISIPRHTIAERIQQLGDQIKTDYQGKQPIFIGVLNGAFMFLADLVRASDLDAQVDFIRISSYGDSDTSSGTVTLRKNVELSLADRDIIIVEDIVETGRSMKFLLEFLAKEKPRSIRIATLLHKDVASLDYTLDYVGFTIDPEFVIGYGLDYAQSGRHLPDIYRAL